MKIHILLSHLRHKSLPNMCMFMQLCGDNKTHSILQDLLGATSVFAEACHDDNRRAGDP